MSTVSLLNHKREVDLKHIVCVGEKKDLYWLCRIITGATDLFDVFTCVKKRKNKLKRQSL